MPLRTLPGPGSRRVCSADSWSRHSVPYTHQRVSKVTGCRLPHSGICFSNTLLPLRTPALRSDDIQSSCPSVTPPAHTRTESGQLERTRKLSRQDDPSLVSSILICQLITASNSSSCRESDTLFWSLLEYI